MRTTAAEHHALPPFPDPAAGMREKIYLAIEVLLPMCYNKGDLTNWNLMKGR
jgi:hypothetical protein